MSHPFTGSVRHPVVAPTSDGDAATSPPKAALSPQPHLEYLGWGPTGNAFVYVHQSNLYYRDAGSKCQCQSQKEEYHLNKIDKAAAWPSSCISSVNSVGQMAIFSRMATKFENLFFFNILTACLYP